MMGDWRSIVRGRISQNLRNKFPNIQKIKRNIIRKYGLKPTLTFYYYAVNPIQYIGEEWVRKSLESIINQGEVVIINYKSTDGILDIAKEYNVKVFNVEEANHYFPESKMSNKIMFESDSNFMVYLNWHIIYPENFKEIIIKNLSDMDISKQMLRLEGGIIQEDGSFRDFYPGTVCNIIYRPYVIYARGYDERLNYKTGSSEYAIFLFNHLFRLSWYRKKINMRHRHYTKQGRVTYLAKTYGAPGKKAGKVYEVVENIFKNLDTEFKNVQNSYW